MIIYEFPFNEHVRVLLRLEALFDKLAYFTGADGVIEHQMALEGLFEILDVVGRSDPKADLIQELEKQRQILLGYRNNPEVSSTTLDGTLYEIEQASAMLFTLQGRFGQSLRDNSWLMSIKNKAVLSGGACGFDLPSYHYWLQQSSVARRTALEQWQRGVMPVQNAIDVILRLLRASSEMEQLTAERGQYQKSLFGSNFQMVRVALGENEQAIPEISANRYVLNIHFTLPPESESKKHYREDNVDFDLCVCSLK